MKRTVICEYVGLGHPDKVADQISDALLDAFLSKDPDTRAGIEVMIKDNIVVLGGEVKSKTQIDYEDIVRVTIDGIDYPANHHLTGEDIKVINLIGKQSPEISRSVDQENGIIGAGDQGFCVGFASNETETYMPMGTYIAKKVCRLVECADYFELGPDTKTQVVVSYDEQGNARVDSILVSTMHQCQLEQVRERVLAMIRNNDMNIQPELFQKHIIGDNPDITINPAGEWHIGGSISDCGITNRKIVVDQYGGYAPVGGGGLSGKDMSKIDRSATYMCRYLAKNIVVAGLSDTAKVELAYMIGVPQPCAINVTLNRNCQLVPKVVQWIRDNIDLSPKGIIERFHGKEARFEDVTRFGHFGVSDSKLADYVPSFIPWEKTDISTAMKDEFLND